MYVVCQPPDSFSGWQDFKSEGTELMGGLSRLWLRIKHGVTCATFCWPDKHVSRLAHVYSGGEEIDATLFLREEFRSPV